MHPSNVHRCSEQETGTGKRNRWEVASQIELHYSLQHFNFRFRMKYRLMTSAFSTTNSLWWHSEHFCWNKRNERVKTNLHSHENLQNWSGAGEKKKKMQNNNETIFHLNALILSMSDLFIVRREKSITAGFYI